jgi:CRISPR-associated endonuclease/helicase Cas3
MKISDFDEFFKIIHGYQPFPWQKRMMEQIAESGWMDNINLPTSSGKTSVIDIAVFYMALKAEGDNAPYRRIFYTVDRRFVVDEAHEEAKALKEKLMDPANSLNIVGKVATILRSIGGDNLPLDVLRLRGGIYHEPVFISNPLQPTVVVSTVDQVGSRLLFRGYGVSDYMRPVHAALAGKDSLIILDEAHLSRPFYETAEYVRRYQGNNWAMEMVGNPLKIVSMSATPGSTDSISFSLNEDDYSNEILARRFKSSKEAVLITHNLPKEDLKKCNSHSIEKKVAGIFADTAIKQMEELKAQGENAPVVGVVVNSVSLAGSIHEILSKQTGSDAVKIVGRTRPYERDQIIDEYLPRIIASMDQTKNQVPLYVIATQTIEVGANIDLDTLVTEIAPLDSLRQRFGRLNRIGKRNKALGAIIRCNCRDKLNEVIYGKAPSETWNWLNKIATRHSVDFGINAMSNLLAGVDQEILMAERKHAPVMLPAHMDTLVQTSPSPRVSPNISEMLHGTSESPADVQVIWRNDIPEPNQQNNSMVFETVSMIPPRSYESVSIPVWNVRSFLIGKGLVLPEPDIEGASITEPDYGQDGRPAYLWTGDEDSRFIKPNEIKPGQTLILPSNYGGYDKYGWNYWSTSPVKDIAEIALSHDTGDTVLRLHPANMDIQFGADRESLKFARILLSECMKSINIGENTDETVLNLLKGLAGVVKDKELFNRIQTLLKAGKRWISTYPDKHGLVMRTFGKQMGDLADDDASSYIGEISLEYHSNGVKEQVRRQSSKLISDKKVQDALEMAGLLHDLGKADPRFQSWLRGGIPYDGGELIAKSAGKRDLYLIGKARRLSGYPKGGRHECYSVAILKRNAGLLNGNKYRDLILYLVGTHHGRGRAMMPATDDTGTDIGFTFCGYRVEYSGIHALDSIDSGWTDLFWMIQRRYGYWGSAFLEMIVRLGDHIESGREATNGRKK